MTHKKTFAAVKGLMESPKTQGELSALSGMEPESTRKLVRSLHGDFGLIEPVGFGKSSGGNKPILWGWKVTP